MGKKKDNVAPCNIKAHFDCDGTGQMCNTCGESETACACRDDSADLVSCKDCAGLGQICVEHESPAGSSKICDEMRKGRRDG